MSDMRALFERQAEWQSRRRSLSWPEKVRMAEAIRSSVEQLRVSREARSGEARATSRPEPEPERG